MAQTQYYTVLPAADATGAIDRTVIDTGSAQGDGLQVVTDPRTFNLNAVLERYELESAPDLVLNRQHPPLRLAELAPRGPVASVDHHLTDVHCQSGWGVIGLAPLDAVFGRQGRHLVALIDRAERILIDEEGPQEAVNTYTDAVNAQYDGPIWVAAEHADAAAAALASVGADAHFWQYGGCCVYGAEILALAARDLIGTTANWTVQAYEVLTRPWRAALGLPHPDDAALLGAECCTAAASRA